MTYRMRYTNQSPEKPYMYSDDASTHTPEVVRTLSASMATENTTVARNRILVSLLISRSTKPICSIEKSKYHVHTAVQYKWYVHYHALNTVCVCGGVPCL